MSHTKKVPLDAFSRPPEPEITVRPVPEVNGPGWVCTTDLGTYLLWAPRPGRECWTADWEQGDLDSGHKRASSPEEALVVFPDNVEGWRVRGFLMDKAREFRAEQT